MWRVSNEVAQQTLDVTTHLNKQDSDSTLSSRFSTNDRMVRYKRLDSFFYIDTFYSKQVFSKQVFPMKQLFVSDKVFVRFYGMKSEKEFVKALNIFCKEVGAPKSFIVYHHLSQKRNEVRTFLNKVGTKLRVLE